MPAVPLPNIAALVKTSAETAIRPVRTQDSASSSPDSTHSFASTLDRSMGQRKANSDKSTTDKSNKAEDNSPAEPSSPSASKESDHQSQTDSASSKDANQTASADHPAAPSSDDQTGSQTAAVSDSAAQLAAATAVPVLVAPIAHDQAPQVTAVNPAIAVLQSQIQGQAVETTAANADSKTALINAAIQVQPTSTEAIETVPVTSVGLPVATAPVHGASESTTVATATTTTAPTVTDLPADSPKQTQTAQIQPQNQVNPDVIPALQVAATTAVVATKDSGPIIPTAPKSAPKTATNTLPVSTEASTEALVEQPTLSDRILTDKNVSDNQAQLATPTQANNQTPSPTIAAQALPSATTNAMQVTTSALQGDKKQTRTALATTETKTAPIADPTTATMTPAPTTTTPTRSAEPIATTPAPVQTPANPMEKAVAQQVSRALVQNLPSGDRMMVLRMTPPELGTVRIEVIEHQGMLTAKIHAEDDGVRHALERALPMMRQELRASDAPIREVSVGDQSQFSQAFAEGHGRQRQGQEPGQRQLRDDEPRFSLDGSSPNDSRRPVREQSLGARISRTGVEALA